ncbi:FAD-binding protein [Saccharopolyspora sp. K220]|uniref:FAD-dependent oxidoreductase n=1 Tax=Saccharopolyspora soli TaxID=2926618 RepID=UPI001F565E5F|nr:FAD-binding protein [Saccharopolyspora soli]MCI2419491.1 FAD-binding protein [Saccharopolyspora soli]
MNSPDRHLGCDRHEDGARVNDAVRYEADVLVLGGGPAGTWAALAAAAAGVSVVLADKGFCGSSGATASGGNNLWYLPDGPVRERSIRARQAQAGGLTDVTWMRRVLETTWEKVNLLAEWGYPFPLDRDATQLRASLQGPEYMRRMRRRVHRSGVRILDHHPAVELLVDGDGVVSGAAGIARQQGQRRWEVRAGAVVVATGGCALLSGGFGTNVDTGDGLLMAAEVGAELSGMEFSTAYALSPEWGVHTKGLMMQFATYYDESGTPLRLADGVPPRFAAAQLLAEGRRVLARLDKAPPHLRESMRNSQPNFFLPLEKAGVNVFSDMYPIRMVYEGTVRGTGGLRVVDHACATTAPGLFAAGDAATRELITGAISGGGSHNGAWAISSGTYAGRGAARFALPRRGAVAASLAPRGRVGIRPSGAVRPGLAPEVIDVAQQHVLPPQRTFVRTGEQLQASAAALQDAWQDAGRHLHGSGRDLLRSRQAAALLACARWITAAALARTETRGMHRRSDRPTADPSLAHRLLVGGLAEIRTRPDPVGPLLSDDSTEELAS